MVIVLTPNAHILDRGDQSARRQKFVKLDKHIPFLCTGTA